MLSRRWSCSYADNSVGVPKFIAKFGLWDDLQAAAAEKIETDLNEVDLVRLAYCDPHGLARSKTLPADSFRVALRNGIDFAPGPLLFDTGHALAIDRTSAGFAGISGSDNFVVVPDPHTFQMLPEIEPRTAWVLGDEFLHDGSPHPFATRSVLRRVCAQFAARDLAPIIGLEIEWYLTRLLGRHPGNVGNGFGLQGFAPIVEAMNAGYQFNLDTYYDSVATVVGPLSMMLLALGLPLRSIEHESGPGQIEVTFDPMLAMDAADAMLLFRTMVKQMCARHGFHASFMALPRMGSFYPSGWHLHQSVMSTTTGRNLFTLDSNLERISSEEESYIEGILAHARDFCLLSVPTVNGYRRFSPRFPLSPTRIDWGFENRTSMIRVLGAGGSPHIENRVAEPCSNPYLSIASQLFSGLEGLIGDPRSGGFTMLEKSDADLLPPVLPQSLRDALGAFCGSNSTRELLGNPLVLCLTKLKESEISRFEAWCTNEEVPADEVTEWEQREYFGIF